MFKGDGKQMRDAVHAAHSWETIEGKSKMPCIHVDIVACTNAIARQMPGAVYVVHALKMTEGRMHNASSVAFTAVSG